jgi:uncharacterized iron-regulated protein
MALRFNSTYKVNINDDLGSTTYWNVRFQDIDVRLNAVESYTATINSIADQVAAQGIARINATVQPFMDGLVAQLNALTTTVASLQNSVLVDQGNLTDQLNTLLAEGQTLIDNLESLGTISDGTF